MKVNLKCIVTNYDFKDIFKIVFIDYRFIFKKIQNHSYLWNKANLFNENT